MNGSGSSTGSSTGKKRFSWFRPIAVSALVISGGLVISGCTTPSGEYGGVWTQDYSGPDGIQGGPVVKSEEVGTGFGPWGGIYNYEEVNLGPPS